MEQITLHTHETNWQKTFASEKQLLISLLKQEPIHIHHVGSTAVPDLLAKPIIDIAIEAAVFPPPPLSSNRYHRSGMNTAVNPG